MSVAARRSQTCGGLDAVGRRTLLTRAAAVLGATAWGATSWGAAAGASATRELSLRQAAQRDGRLYGAAINPGQVDADPAFAALVRAQCGLLTPENAMKWDALRPAPEVFDFAPADRVVALAQAQDAQVHGHCLVWHEALPDWARQTLADATPTAARGLLERHIARVAGRYAGVVRSWDVVNEAVERNDGRADGLRRSPWLEAIGADYLALAFQAARAAAPRARLAIADYGLEYDDIGWMVEKRATMLRLLGALKTRGVPIDALAIQGHLRGDRPPAFGAGLRRFLAEVAALGLEIYVTELDVDDQRMAGDPGQRDDAAAEIYGRFLDAVLDAPAVRSVVTWGLSDRYSSKSTLFPRADGQPVRPLPFDRRLSPKACAYAIDRAFAGG